MKRLEGLCEGVWYAADAAFIVAAEVLKVDILGLAGTDEDEEDENSGRRA